MRQLRIVEAGTDEAEALEEATGTDGFDTCVARRIILL